MLNHKCTSCGDIILPETNTIFGGKCYDCYMELEFGVIQNGNVHIVGSPDTKKVDELERIFGG